MTVGEDDFESTTQQRASFAPGSGAGTIQCIHLSIIDDQIQEIEEYFIVSADRDDLFSNTAATVVIQDNDGKFEQLNVPSKISFIYPLYFSPHHQLSSFNSSQ